jgi:hypothetical protein
VSVYRFISAEKARTPVSVCCELLGVSRSGYYDWAQRAPSDRALVDAWLLEQIKEIHRARRGVYGARRITPSCGSRTALGRQETRRAADVPGRTVRPRSSQARQDHDPGARRPRRRRPRRAPVPASRAHRALGRRHHLPQDLGGLGLSRRRPRRLQPPDRRLGDGRSHALRARRRRAADGARPAPAGAGTDPPLRPGQPGRIPAVVATLDQEGLRWAGRGGRTSRSGRHSCASADGPLPHDRRDASVLVPAQKSDRHERRSLETTETADSSHSNPPPWARSARAIRLRTRPRRGRRKSVWIPWFARWSSPYGQRSGTSPRRWRAAHSSGWTLCRSSRQTAFAWITGRPRRGGRARAPALAPRS